MCNEVVRREPYTLRFIPDHFKAKEMCDKAIKEDPSSFQFVPDWFVTQEQINRWYDDYYDVDSDDDDEDEFFEWYNGYKKRKAQKAKIKDELMPIAWHPSHWWDWCIPEDEKKESEKLFLTI